ncbi:unnamed protein product [Cuscuta campestris]|uniref:S-acyltransferase n=1 Tax=Cuscuta campestris TaxID=132261 RepID=A0A484MZH0_9ASTE|nr:unnamed protein product [Cuscuta campestris]
MARLRRHFHSTNPRLPHFRLPIRMTISFSQRRNVQLARSESLLDQSTVAYVAAVLLGLTIINNCIGEKNTRYFMAFLFWHFLLCVYGTVAIALVLAGQLKEQQVIRILTAYYGIENSFRTLAPYVVQVN